MPTRPRRQLALRAVLAVFVTLALVGAFASGFELVLGRLPLKFSNATGLTIPTHSLRDSCVTNDRLQNVFLVTGAAGFVGSHVATALKERGDAVVGLDNVNDYYPTVLKQARIQKLREIGVYVVEADLNDAAVVRKVLDTCKVTIVLHLAAQAGVRYAVKNPASYVHSNVAGFVTLLEEIVRTGPVPKVIFASSSSVYGLNTKVSFSETDVTDSPASL